MIAAASGAPSRPAFGATRRRFCPFRVRCSPEKSQLGQTTPRDHVDTSTASPDGTPPPLRHEILGSANSLTRFLVQKAYAPQGHLPPLCGFLHLMLRTLSRRSSGYHEWICLR
jgi:hypothetical protein